MNLDLESCSYCVGSDVRWTRCGDPAARWFLGHDLAQPRRHDTPFLISRCASHPDPVESTDWAYEPVRRDAAEVFVVMRS